MSASEKPHRVELLGDREVIVVLLEHYQDVRDGLQDWHDRRSLEPDLIALMCEAWNHRSYRELERLRIVLRDSHASMYRALAGLYFWPEARRMAYCRSCKQTAPALAIGRFHRHGRGSFELLPVSVRMVSPDVSRREAQAGVSWLVDHWHGVPFIPDDLLGVNEHLGERLELAAA